MLTSRAVEWPPSFYELREGKGCPICAEGRPDENRVGTRIFAGEVTDAYLRRTGIQRGYTIVTWRGRHVAEPTELEPDEATAYWAELLRVGRALEQHLQPVKLNYNILGNEVPHLHTHVIPRYADDPKPGWPFPFPEEEPPPHDEGEFRRDVEALRALLG
jgi:diadenosine tetraphosphate (Ap4A) HIT family hydrolase